MTVITTRSVITSPGRVPGGLLRGVALLARAAGLLGHISEEIRHPIAMQMYRLIEEHADYVPPAE